MASGGGCENASEHLNSARERAALFSREGILSISLSTQDVSRYSVSPKLFVLELLSVSSVDWLRLISPPRRVPVLRQV